MTPPNVTANPARYYEWLQHWMAIPNPADGIATGRNPDTSCANNSATSSKLSPVSHVCGGSRDGGFSGRAAS